VRALAILGRLDRDFLLLVVDGSFRVSRKRILEAWSPWPFGDLGEGGRRPTTERGYGVSGLVIRHDGRFPHFRIASASQWRVHACLVPKTTGREWKKATHLRFGARACAGRAFANRWEGVFWQEKTPGGRLVGVPGKR